MRSTRELVEEHRVILGVLEGLERALAAADAGGDVPVAFLRDLVTFSQAFVDRCHHGKEEACLFPCLQRRGIPRERGPIAVMLEEHEAGRRLVREIAAQLDRHAQGAVPARAVLEPCRQYLELLRAHIAKENDVLFPMGEGVLHPADDTATGACYDGVEHQLGHGVHHEMVRLAERLSGGPL
ncbi:MAG: hemerythrin domain-containing protein [Firmicutes bacterium]|nr:hemerythrin domain-containing protein [Bacillota bacterium]